jgi:O-antigen ligase
LVCILKAFHTRRPALIAFYLAGAGGAFFIVYRVQSRGAVFGLAAALVFALFTARRLRRHALPFVVFTAMVVAVLETPGVLSDRVTVYLHRGQTEAEFRSMTGRTQIYKNGLAAFWDAPLLGRGQRADRLVGLGHAHNSYLQALLNAGILGGMPYVASWIAGWVLFFRLLKRRCVLRPEDRTALLEAGTVMMFFTVRSFPETTTASFAVDLLAMAAVYVYLEVLFISTVPRPLKRSVRLCR